MADRLILCSECGTRNRVSSDRAVRPTCGSCGKALAVPGYLGTGIGHLSKPVFWFALGAVTVAGVLYYNASLAPTPVTGEANSWDNDPLADQLASKKQPTPEPLDFTNQSDPYEDEYVPVTISTGVVKRAKNAVAPLKITTEAGYNYFVKLVDKNDNDVMTVYIVGGEPFETKAPLGTFELRYVAGNIWYGEEEKRFFGKPPKTIGSKADELFEFSVQQSETETIYSGHTIELILQTSGNLRVTPISVEDF